MDPKKEKLKEFVEEFQDFIPEKDHERYAKKLAYLLGDWFNAGIDAGVEEMKKQLAEQGIHEIKDEK